MKTLQVMYPIAIIGALYNHHIYMSAKYFADLVVPIRLLSSILPKWHYYDNEKKIYLEFVLSYLHAPRNCYFNFI